jgi:parallel beta-helix repeat protein
MSVCVDARFSKAILILTFILMGINFLPVYAQTSRTIYVDVNNIGDPLEDGSLTHPFDRIQEAVDVANSGDVIVVAAGVYYEEVVFSKNKSGISLLADEGTIIDGEGRRGGIRLGFHVAPEYIYNVSVIGFTIRNCVKGITFIRCRNICLRNNTMSGNKYGFSDYSLGVNDVDTSNTVDGMPIYYWVHEHDRQIPSDAGFVAVVESRNITVRDLNLEGNGQGVLIKNSTDCTVENVTVLNNQDGIYLDAGCTNNIVISNKILNCEITGIYLSASSNNVLRDNIAAGRYYGFYVTTTSSQCSGNLLANNTIQGHWKGIVLEGYANLPVVNNIFTDNTVSDNDIGVSTYLSASNLFYHNNFVNNIVQVESSESQNQFDYLQEGNYWSNYQGFDEDKDAIGDTPCVINEEIMDHFPLMGLFSGHEVVWEGTSYLIETISSLDISGLSFRQAEKLLAFSFTQNGNQTGFCRIIFPEVLLGGPYTMMVNEAQVDVLNQEPDGTSVSLYFESPISEGYVEVLGETAISEFHPILLASILTAIVTLVVFLKRTRQAKPVCGTSNLSNTFVESISEALQKC